MQGTFSTTGYAAALMAGFGCRWDFLILLCTQLLLLLSQGKPLSVFPGRLLCQAGWLLSHRLSPPSPPPLLLLQRWWYKTDSEYYLLQFTLTVRCLFYTSFSLELCRQPAPTPAQRASSSFLWLLAYVFYYPVFHNGPILNFPEFFKQVESSGGSDKFYVGLSLLDCEFSPQMGLLTECGIHGGFGNGKRLLNVQPKIIQSLMGNGLVVFLAVVTLLVLS